MAEAANSERLAHDAASESQIRAYLEDLLGSPAFASAQRRRELLRYVMERTLAGNAAGITEYGIGLDVLRKPPTFDPRIDSTVRSEMSRLRRALAGYYETAGAADPWRIEFPNRGYVPVVAPHSPTPATTVKAPKRRRAIIAWPALAIALTAIVAVWLWRAAPANRPVRSVVVLPFENLTGDPKQDYLADGITEDLTDSLAQIPSLRVVARTSAFQFKGKGIDVRRIGRELDVDAVVEGSIQTRERGVRLTVQVNRSANGYHIISRTFDGPREDLPKLESELVSPLVSALRPGASVGAHPPAASAEAHDFYLKAWGYRGQGSVYGYEQAIAFLKQAIERDPKYADAYAALAGVYASGALNFAPKPLQDAPLAKAAAAKALEFDWLSAPAYAAEGFVDGMILMDWKNGEDELRTAIRLMPGHGASHNWLGLTLLAQGKAAEAISELKIAAGLDPLNAAPSATLGFGYYMARQYDAALQQFLKLQRLHPNVIAVRQFIGDIWKAKGDFGRAMAEYRSVVEKIPGVRYNIAHTLAAMGNAAEARQMAAELENPKPGEAAPDAFSIAAIHAALGDADQAFAWLDRAYEDRKIALLKVHPALDPLRTDPRYRELLRKTNLASKTSL